MGLVMTGYPVGVFKAIKVDCLFFGSSRLSGEGGLDFQEKVL